MKETKERNQRERNKKYKKKYKKGNQRMPKDIGRPDKNKIKEKTKNLSITKEIIKLGKKQKTTEG